MPTVASSRATAAKTPSSTIINFAWPSACAMSSLTACGKISARLGSTVRKADCTNFVTLPGGNGLRTVMVRKGKFSPSRRSEEHTSELQSRGHLVCRLLLEKKKKIHTAQFYIT